MPDGDKESESNIEEAETYLGHPVRKCPPAYAEGVDRGPSVKPRGRKRPKE
ncbi:hypothetical protein [Fimbriiglobus ruber]|uniref:Uncharacterized protein n=1 Tax=Fimbriiglobus ruber TaxID=1908690 RepID=A0A225D1H1_9BACT|nr:hypothetical protein [Fimbriiglobus ruber]OWK35221.1 hypothetical protein FRUB_10063 [Fimbriiglobus ruber]OWK35431.1 hypothetical protein FRUB_07994 [Fimbriiglobus ruber]